MTMLPRHTPFRFCAALIVSLAVAVGDEDRDPAVFIAGGELADAWIMDEKTGELVFTGTEKIRHPQLVFATRPFGQEPGRVILIETDAPRCRIAGSGVDFSFDILPRQRNALLIHGSPKSFEFKLNRADMTAERAQWMKLFLGKDEHFTLHLPGATYAFVKATTPARDPDLFPNVAPDQRPSRPAAAVVTSPADGKGRPGEPAVPAVPLRSSTDGPPYTGSYFPQRQLLLGPDRATFELQGLYLEGARHPVGVAFLVEEGGLAVTWRHNLLGCSGAVAVTAVDGQKVEAPVELWAEDRSLDLALIRIDMANHAKLRGVAPIRLSPAAPVHGTAVWALGRSMGHSNGVLLAVRGSIGMHYSDATFTTGAPSRTRDQFTALEQLNLPPDRAVPWMLLGAEISNRLNGAMTVDASGQVLGMARWTPFRAATGFPAVAIGSRDLVRFIEKRPRLPQGFADAWTPTDGPPGLSPMPVVEVGAPMRAAELRRYTAAFERAVSCQVCKGAGKVSKTVASRQGAGLVQKEVRRTVQEECSRCDGSGSGNAQALDPAMARLLQGLAALSPDDPGSTEAARELEDRIARAFKSDSTYQSRTARQLLESPERLALKTPVAAIARIHEVRLPQGHLIIADLGDGRFVALTRSVVGGILAPDRKALVGGLYAGQAQIGPADPMPVLQGGLAVALDATPPSSAGGQAAP